MNYSLAWDPSFLEPVLAVAVTLFGLVGYWITIHSDSLKAKFVKRFGEEQTKIRWIMFWRYAGLFFYGIVPAIVMFSFLPHNLAHYGVSFVNIPESLLWIAGFSLLIIILQSQAAKKPGNMVQYPQIRVDDWHMGLVLKNSYGWFIYLLGYEFMYRGVLLFGLVEAFGTWPAILVNTIVYSVAHIPKGNREALMAIPFGIVLCILTLRTETIWIAFIVHLAVAYSNDNFAIVGSKTMRFVKR